MKKPELAFKCFIRFLLARAAMTWGVELMAGAFRVYQFYRQGRMGRVIIMKNAAKGGGGMTTDEALYRRYLSGDEDALGTLMERYGTKLTLYLDGYLCDLHEAEDLMIEAFAYRIAKRPAIRDGGFRAYLYQSARHMALRLLHKKRAGNCFSLDALTEEPEARELVEETVQSAERARLLRTCMGELHEDYREALFLVYFEGLSHAETAAVMGKREKQVADLIYRGKIALRKRLEQEGITDAHNSRTIGRGQTAGKGTGAGTAAPPCPWNPLRRDSGLSRYNRLPRAGHARHRRGLFRYNAGRRHGRQHFQRPEPGLSRGGPAGLRVRRVRDGAVRPPARA